MGTATSSRTVRVLAEALRDNDVPNDANVALFALGRLGEGALPHLGEERRSADEQAQRLLELVQETWGVRIQGPTDASALRQRFELHSVTRWGWANPVHTPPTRNF